MSDVEQVERLIEVLRTDDALRARVERALLSERLLALPAQVAELATTVAGLVEITTRQGERLDRIEERLAILADRLDQLTERVDQLTERVDQLTQRVDRLTERVDALVEVTARQGERMSRMDLDLGRLKGFHLEHKFAHNPGAWVHQLARRARIVTLDELLDDAGVADVLSDEDYALLVRADSYVRGRAPGTGEQVTLVVEVTWKPHSGDVERQAARLGVLSRHVGPVAAVVVAVEPPIESVRGAFEDAGIVLVVDEAERWAA